MILAMLRCWDIRRADVNWLDEPNHWKPRPVILLDQTDDGNGWYAVYVTSKVSRYAHRSDAVKLDWRREGLDRPSLALCDEILIINNEDIHERLGILTPRDVNMVEDRVEWDE
ncbi:type II toxin-antitoxin system PemK/MazF family toxin [Bifidobacterium oedipodis]|uniref:PemK-like protein n=1 Tax=Bifidobacterium oedipodis TaxID=2675322 RepID=A0A7Y0HSR6_9BIFI|nr:type II toxin-antitoxin system PemK/MazF family toxin [Bifidobacterium sp. DSM 109957]NMM93302.1 hypothetical protein [Bifidobacterium sp. DSM 109957]